MMFCRGKSLLFPLEGPPFWGLKWVMGRTEIFCYTFIGIFSNLKEGGVFYAETDPVPVYGTVCDSFHAADIGICPGQRTGQWRRGHQRRPV